MTRMSIRVKILLSVGLIIAIMLGISSYSYIRLLERDYLESIAWNSESLAQILVNEIIDLYTYVPNMQSLLEGLTIRCMELYEANKEKHVRYIAVINASGVIAAHSNIDSLGKSVESPLVHDQLQHQKQIMMLDRDMYRTFVPVFGTEEHVYIGSVEVGIPRQIVDEKIGLAILQAGRLLLIFVTTVFLAFSAFVHMLITKPIRLLVKVGEKVADGDIKDISRGEFVQRAARRTTQSRDEIQTLTAVFYRMIRYLQEKTDIANRISVGDLRPDILPRSEDDILGNAFQRMAEYLHEISTIASTIARGDLRRDIQIKGQYDMLGQSFQQMITYIQHVADVAEKISEGDLRVDVNLRSDMDVLNYSLQKMVSYIRDVADVAQEIADNNLHVSIRLKSDHDVLNNSLQQMLKNLRTAGEKVEHSMAEVEQQNWFRSGLIELSDLMRGEQDTNVLANNVVTYIAKHLQAQVGVLYLPDVRNGDTVLQARGRYADSLSKGTLRQFRLGEGIVGQAALARKASMIHDVPQDHISILLGLGEVAPRNILVIPLIHNGEVRGVLELGTAHTFTEQHQEFLNQVQEKIAMTIHSTQARIQMQSLLEETRQQAEALGRQEHKLRQANDALAEQTDILARQKIELEEKNLALENTRRLMKKKAHDLEDSQELLEEKMRELEVSERYKSDFLANMSHELRTPLNSLLILAKILHENTEGNLSQKQLEHAHTIYESGAELLELLNEVLDLSKVETGKMLLNIDEMSIRGLARYITQRFTHVAEEKGLSLTIEVADELPPSISTDRQRVEQIMKNLLSNALKFTAEGEVKVTIDRPAPTTQLPWSPLAPQRTIAFAVSDTGIGIPEKKQRVIFEAFQQLDRTVSRKYGGTGLGLSISRELTRLLGGELHVQSESGKGSIFTLYLPEKYTQSRAGENLDIQSTGSDSHKESREKSGIDSIRDDRHDLDVSDILLLIIESDPERAKMIFDLGRERGFKGLIAGDGEAGLHLAYQYKPQAIVLNLALPRMDGKSVMEKLRKNPDTRYIPVHTTVSHPLKRQQGADQPTETTAPPAGVLLERVQDEITLFLYQVEAGRSEGPQNADRMSSRKESALKDKTILLVDDDIRNSYALKSVLEEHEMHVVLAGNGQEALSLLEERQEIDLVLMDIMMPVMDGYETTQAIRKHAKFQQLPIITFTARSMRGDRQRCIENGANDYLAKPVDIEKLLSLLRVWLY